MEKQKFIEGSLKERAVALCAKERCNFGEWWQFKMSVSPKRRESKSRNSGYDCTTVIKLYNYNQSAK
jgi:hypothetical protein